MKQSYTTESLKSLFQYPFAGKEWGRKMLYLGLFWLAGFFIPLIPWLFAFGYCAQILRQVARHEPGVDLPEWTDWNRILIDGLRMVGAMLVIILPVTLIALVGLSVYLGSTFTMMALVHHGYDWLSFLSMSGGTTVFSCMMIGIALLSLCLGIAYIPATTHMLVEERFAALFRVGEWWRVLRANLGGYLITFLLFCGLSAAIQIVSQLVVSTLFLCSLLPLIWAVSSPYLSVISAVLCGQAYWEGRERLAPEAAEELPAAGD